MLWEDILKEMRLLGLAFLELFLVLAALILQHTEEQMVILTQELALTQSDQVSICYIASSFTNARCPHPGFTYSHHLLSSWASLCATLV